MKQGRVRMKTAICYYSRHHGNTLKVLKAMAEGTGIDLIDVTWRTMTASASPPAFTIPNSRKRC